MSTLKMSNFENFKVVSLSGIQASKVDHVNDVVYVITRLMCAFKVLQIIENKNAMFGVWTLKKCGSITNCQNGFKFCERGFWLQIKCF